MSKTADLLDNTQITLPFCRSELRERRFDLRDDLRKITVHNRLGRCGRVRIAPTVTLRITGDVAGWTGLETCGSVWVCPVCSSRVMLRRGLELASGLDGWMAAGNRVVMTTSTVRHHAGHSLHELLDALGYGWSRVTSGKYWMRDREVLGLLGYFRALEVLHNLRNGWHPHLHSLFLVDAQVDDVAAHRFGSAVQDRWSAALARKGFEAYAVGQRVDLITRESAPEKLGRYLAKMPGNDLSLGQSLGYELTATQSKSGRSIGRTQWALAASAAGGDARDVRHWNNFERATKGRRQMTMSQGLREALRLGIEQTDEEIAAEVLGTEADSVGAITADGWATMLEHPGLPATLLTVAEQGGWAQVRRVLDGFGIEYIEIGGSAS